MPWPIVPAPSTAIVLIGVLSATEVRLPFLEICFQAFLRVVTLEQTLLQLALERETFRETRLETGLHRTLHMTDRLCGLVRRRELCRVLVDRNGEGASAQFRIAPHVIDEPDRVRLFEGRQRPHRHHFYSPGLADQPREALGAASAGQHAKRHFRHADLSRTLPRNANVRGHRDLE